LSKQPVLVNAYFRLNTNLLNATDISKSTALNNKPAPWREGNLSPEVSVQQNRIPCSVASSNWCPLLPHLSTIVVKLRVVQKWSASEGISTLLYRIFVTCSIPAANLWTKKNILW